MSREDDEYLLQLSELIAPIFPLDNNPSTQASARALHFRKKVKSLSAESVESLEHVFLIAVHRTFRFALITELYNRFGISPVLELARAASTLTGGEPQHETLERIIAHFTAAGLPPKTTKIMPHNYIRVDQISNSASATAGLGDLVYVIFLRIDGLGTMVAEEVAATVMVLSGLVAKATSNSPSIGVHSSVYGRIILVPREIGLALDLATEILGSSAQRGVLLAVGIACGRIDRTRDLERDNVVGNAINRAARLAHLKAGAGRLAVDEATFTDAVTGYKRFMTAFAPLESGQVKRTELRYSWHSISVLCTNPLLAAPREYIVEVAHAVVYDIARFSEQVQREMIISVEETRRFAERALDSAGGARPVKSESLFYAPAGDGGALVFLASGTLGSRAVWAFVKDLAARNDSKINLRIGVATGTIVIVGDALPVGQAIFLADKLSGLPPSGGICVSQRFWQAIVEDENCGAWIAEKVEDHPTALLLRQSPESQ